MPAVTTHEVLLQQLYSAQTPPVSGRLTHLVVLRQSLALRVGVLAAAGLGFEPVGWQLGGDWGWRWVALGL